MSDLKIKGRDKSFENKNTKYSKSKDFKNSPVLKRNLSKDEIDQEYKKHVINVNKKYQLLAKTKSNAHHVYNKYIELKRCEICTDFINDEFLLLCDICDDGYHIYCLVRLTLTKKQEKFPEEFECPKCKNEKPCGKKTSAQKTLDDVYEKMTCQKDRKCSKCEVKINSKKYRNCNKCRKDFHENCFSGKNDDEKTNSAKIICSLCEENIQKIIKKNKISDYFKLEKKVPLNANKKSQSELDNPKQKTSVSTKEPEYLTTKFKLFKNTSNVKKQILRESLYRALLVKEIKFDDDLYYDEIETFAHHNNSSFEPGIQKVSDYNLNIYRKFKERTREANYPALEIIDDEKQGFVVKATDEIPILTLLCEYSGEVHFARKKLFDSNDSIMDLIRTPYSSTSLVIAPEKRGNIARFFSGINNNNISDKKKQNVSSIRLDINGSVHVLLYASRKIKKNEVLYYDYNAGGFSGYPTENFV